jgi:hypothetical protein
MAIDASEDRRWVTVTVPTWIYGGDPRGFFADSGLTAKPGPDRATLADQDARGIPPLSTRSGPHQRPSCCAPAERRLVKAAARFTGMDSRETPATNFRNRPLFGCPLWGRSRGEKSGNGADCGEDADGRVWACRDE